MQICAHPATRSVDWGDLLPCRAANTPALLPSPSFTCLSPLQVCEGAATRSIDWGDLLLCDLTTARFLLIQTTYRAPKALLPSSAPPCLRRRQPTASRSSAS